VATRAALTVAEKQYIYDRKQEGGSLAQIALELDCARATARKWWRNLRDGRTTRPRGRPRVGILSTYPTSVREAAIAIKRAYPHWGPANVKLELKHRLELEEKDLPSDARLSALFKALCPEAVQPRRQRYYPVEPPGTAMQPHQRWQVDSQEAIRVGDTDVATLLNIRDPVGALMIASRAFVVTTEKRYRKLTLEEVQDTLRQAFTEWGMPLEIQTDREQVYIGAPQGEFPSLFTLWLVGLRISHLVSRGGRPTDQAQVERNHRTLGDMAYQDQRFSSVDDLQAALDRSRRRYNSEFPAQASDCAGHPPLTAHPWATHSRRAFHPDVEWMLFDISRVDLYLARTIWTRTVSAIGTVEIGRHCYSVGRRHAHETVSVRFMPPTRVFRIQASDGSWVTELPSVGLDALDIIGRMPIQDSRLLVFQLSLPLEGV
jgi:transposase-like protein